MSLETNINYLKLFLDIEAIRILATKKIGQCVTSFYYLFTMIYFIITGNVLKIYERNS